MRVTLWGTRGSLVAPGRDTVRYGGNTPCVQVADGETDLILDAGIGIVPLGERVMATPPAEQPHEFHILFSHFHWDHVMGLPFFIPIYLPSTRLHLYGADPGRVRNTLDVLFQSAYSPIKGAHNLGADLRYHAIPEEGATVGEARVTGCAVTPPHPTLTHSTTAYRIDLSGRSLVYATDHEVGLEPDRDAALVALARGADLLIHDAYCTPEDYESMKGWGHSTFEQAVRMAVEAGVDRLVLFHHHPRRKDDQLDEILERSQALAPGTLEVTAAVDGSVLEL